MWQADTCNEEANRVGPTPIDDTQVGPAQTSPPAAAKQLLWGL